jgi:NAD(P)-dependent dehydrogenase (short-subunit alcohol dehydrogenase family)
MAGEYAEHGIRVNAVSTDVTHSHQLEVEAERIAAEDGESRTATQILEDWGSQRPLGRLGQPEDIANAVCWLASDKADYVVGTIVRVSGGGNLR